MKDSQTIEIEDVGPVLFERSQRASRAVITVTLSRGVRVAVPLSSSFKKAEEFVLVKKDWIINHLEKLRHFERACENRFDPDMAVDKRQARALLTKKVRLLARKFGFSYGRVSIRQQKTRWGSCSANNNISLNMHLANLPEEMIDYVVLHELVHTRIKNHGASFWTAMDALVGNGRKMRSKLRGYRLD